MYATLNLRIEGGRVWKFEEERKPHKARIWIIEEGPKPTKVFTNCGGVLITLAELTLPAIGCLLKRIVLGLPRKNKNGKQQMTFIVDLEESITITEGFQWANGKQIFDTNTHHLRGLQNARNNEMHVDIAKWAAYTPQQLVPER